VSRRVVRLLVAVVGLAVLGGVAGCGLGGGGSKTLTAHFDRTIGLYKHSDVRILGVRIGEVTSITPEGRTVRVEMTYDNKYKIPAEAKAVVVAPSIVSDRYVQLTPTWKPGAPVLAAGADLDAAKTAVPVELDQIYSALDQLNVSLGPDGANKNGALSDLLATSARNLDGNGQLLGSTITDLSTAIGTLSDQREDLFGTIRNLQDFTTTIKNSDTTVRRFNQDLADVAAQLAAERQDLATAIRQLAVALGEVSTFVRDNKAALTSDVKGLAEVTKVLVRQKAALSEFLDTAPTALSNLQLAYNPRSGTLDTRSDMPGGPTKSITDALCKLVRDAASGPPLPTGPLPADEVCAALAGLLNNPPPPGGPLPPICVTLPTAPVCLPSPPPGLPGLPSGAKK
jgi:phospholipid/cholesterol/gamma-HCH transport system substrate-binding protein